MRAKKDLGIVPLVKAWRAAAARVSLADRLRLGPELVLMNLGFMRFIKPGTKSYPSVRVSLSQGGFNCTLRKNSGDVLVLSELVCCDDMIDLLENKLEKPPRTILDIGAHIGLFSMLVKTIYPACWIAAVEPNPAALEQLLENFSLNDIEIDTVLPVGVAARTGSREFFPNRWKASAGYSLSISAQRASNSARPESKGVEPSIVVETYTIADLLDHLKVDRISLLKIDVEGIEKELFREPAWLDRVEAIVLDLHLKYISADDILQSLKAFNFDLQWISSRLLLAKRK